MDDEIEAKKELLQKEILDQNYDQNKFIVFCTNKKENGDDLTQWTLDELKLIVKEFIEIENKESSIKQNGEEIKNSENQENKIENSLTEKERQEKEKNENIEDNINNIQKGENVEKKVNKTQTIQCRKLEKTALNDKVIEVIVQNPKIIETSFISSNYVNYEVLTKTMNWTVHRRYSDFIWLRNILCKIFIGQVVPPIPNKKTGGRRFEEDFIEKRMKFLNKFISAVLENEVFKTSECLIAFLSMTDHNQFEAKMKELTSFQPSPYIEEYKTFTGNLIITSPEEDNEKYFKNIEKYIRIQNQLFERLNYNLKDFYKNLYSAQKSMEAIQKDFEILHLLNSRVENKEPITKTFEEYGIFFKNWSRILYKQNITIKTCLKDFFKYQRMEGTSYEELIQRRNEIRDKYLNFKNKLIQKKEKYWINKDITKWEIDDTYGKVDKAKLLQDKEYAFSQMCSKESYLLDSYQKQLGYASKSNIDELRKMIKMHCKKYIENDSNFLKEFYPTLTDGLNVYSTFQMFIATSQMNMQIAESKKNEIKESN